jgi:hypothetical protein
MTNAIQIILFPPTHFFILGEKAKQASPRNSARVIREKFFVGKRRQIAGIMDLFQDLATNYRRKRAAKSRRRRCEVMPKKK